MQAHHNPPCLVGLVMQACTSVQSQQGVCSLDQAGLVHAIYSVHHTTESGNDDGEESEFEMFQLVHAQGDRPSSQHVICAASSGESRVTEAL